MTRWTEDPEPRRVAGVLESIYLLARRKRAVVHRYVDGKALPIGPKSDDADWDHVIRMCESLGLRQSILRVQDADVSTLLDNKPCWCDTSHWLHSTECSRKREAWSRAHDGEEGA